VARIRANDTKHPLPLDDAAFAAETFHGWSDFHGRMREKEFAAFEGRSRVPEEPARSRPENQSADWFRTPERDDTPGFGRGEGMFTTDFISRNRSLLESSNF
jgi:hypothetical protein